MRHRGEESRSLQIGSENGEQSQLFDGGGENSEISQSTSNRGLAPRRIEFLFVASLSLPLSRGIDDNSRPFLLFFSPPSFFFRLNSPF